MARQKSTSGDTQRDIGSKILILDNGAYTIKGGFSHPNIDLETGCHVIANCIAHSQRDKKTYIGAEIDTCNDYGELALRRPVENGFVVNWEGEKAIWERTLFDKNAVLKCDARDTNLILTEAPNAPSALSRHMDEMVFEEFEFASYYRTIAPCLNAYAPSPFPENSPSPPGVPLECLLVIDAGHSHTTVTPLYHGRPLQAACRRLDVGGKTLTNQLKALISRTYNVSKEDWLVGEMKEDICYVSHTFNSDLERVWKGGLHDSREIDSSIVVDYVLPDYETIKRGFPRPHDVKLKQRLRDLGPAGGPKEHVVTIGNERFTVSELLFTPSDIGMQEEGVVGTVLQSLNALPKELWQAFLANIVVVGGTSKLPGFLDRVEADLRSIVDEDYMIRVKQAADPVKNVWLGGARLAQNEEVLRQLLVTRLEYLEEGGLWLRRKFAGKVGR